jgi:hypothetical protein
LARSTGLEYWRDAGSGPEIDPGAMERILSHPRFDEAMRHSVTRALAFFREETQFNLVFLDQGTFLLGFLALYLHVTGGLTHRRLAEMGRSSSILSSGRASAILFHLRSKGLVRRAEKRSSDRTVIYTPASKMMDWFRDRVRGDIEAQAMIEPAVLPFLERLDEPGMHEQFLAVVGEDALKAARKPDPELAAVTAVAELRAGELILYRLAKLADDGGTFPSPGIANISISALAEQFRVSRTHVRRILKQCERNELIARHGSDASYAVLPKLREQLRRQTAIFSVAGMRMIHFALESSHTPQPDLATEPKERQQTRKEAELG